MSALLSARRWFAAVVGTAAGLLAWGALDASSDAPEAAALQLDQAAIPQPCVRSGAAGMTTTPRVELAGCEVVRGGARGVGPPVCQVPRDGGLRVWVNAAPGEFVRIEPRDAVGAELPLPPESGRLFEVHVRAEAPWLRVAVARASDAFSEEPALAPAREPSEIERLGAARRSDPDGTERRASQLHESDDAATRARASGLIARIRRSRGDLAGARALLVRALAEDRQAGLISDLYRDSFALVYTLAVQLRQFAEARAVLADLARLGEAGLAAPSYEARAPYYAALVAHEAGDLRAALESYRASRAHALRLGDATHCADVLSQEAVVLLDLGRADEAAALYREAAPLMRSPDPCAEATFFNNWADLMLQIADAFPAAKVDAGPPLERARALVQRDCADPQLRGYVALGRAQVSLRQGDRAAAHEALDAAADLLITGDARDAAQLTDLRARLALDEGDLARAAQSYERLASIAERGVLPSYRRRAALGRAELLERAGDAPRARRAYEEVARLVAHDSLLAPLGEGRLGFLEHLSAGAERYVAFLLDRPGGAALAAEVARRSLAQMLSSLETVERIRGLGDDERHAWEARLAGYRLERAAIEDEARDEWKLSSDERARARDTWRHREERARAALDEALATVERTDTAERKLSSPRDGELFLVYFPLGAARWAGFAITPTAVMAQTWTMAAPLDAAPARFAERFFAPFQAQLDRARSVRFFVPSSLRAIDFHALPYRDAPLFERVPVAYGLDVRGVADEEVMGADPRTASADPRTASANPRSASIDPRTASADPRTVGADPRTVGAAPRIVGAAPRALLVADPRGSLPDARGEGELVRARLEQGGVEVALLTAQGEPRATHANVRDGLERAGTWLFHFAGHAKFSALDGWGGELPLAENGVLTVSDVFALARVPRLVVLSGCETGRADGLGLAHAFVAAGAAAAVGATRPLPDSEAREVMRLFYDNLPRDLPPAEAAALALQAAERALARQPNPTAAWKSLRVFVP